VNITEYYWNYCILSNLDTHHTINHHCLDHNNPSWL